MHEHQEVLRARRKGLTADYLCEWLLGSAYALVVSFQLNTPKEYDSNPNDLDRQLPRQHGGKCRLLFAHHRSNSVVQNMQQFKEIRDKVQ